MSWEYIDGDGISTLRITLVGDEIIMTAIQASDEGINKISIGYTREEAAGIVRSLQNMITILSDPPA